MEDKKILVNLELSDVKSVLSFLHNFSHDSFLLKHNLELLNKKIEELLVKIDADNDCYLENQQKAIPAFLERYKNALQSNYEKEMSFIEIFSELLQHMESERLNKIKEAEAKYAEQLKKMDIERTMMGLSSFNYTPGFNPPIGDKLK
jgi:hypothetical protein